MKTTGLFIKNEFVDFLPREPIFTDKQKKVNKINSNYRY